MDKNKWIDLSGFVVVGIIIIVLFIYNRLESVKYQPKELITVTAGYSLKIAVVGNESEFPYFSSISYHKRELDNLVTNEEENFDALIITKEAFSEADKDQFVEDFNKVKYPVFFYEAKGISDDAFLEKGVTLDSSKINSSAYIRGYLNKEKERVKWVLHLPDNKNISDKEISDKEFSDKVNIFIQIYEIIVESKR
ncbi:hypothetical protein ACQJ0Y_25405 [Peribacillus simplex]|uniref:hypothetical protein n=1 Tax=Peribacillus simplex TaxID=1478 RepID=UPI003CEACF6C